MDINCTTKCVYQIDGKCTLNYLPSLSKGIRMSTEPDCPYCQI